MAAPLVFALAFALGCVNGLRSFSGLSTLSLGARLGWAHFGATAFAFLDAAWAAPLFCVLALGELYADKQAWMPSRKKPGALATRLILGGTCAAALASAAGQEAYFGFLAGAAGALCGTFGGYEVRVGLVRMLGIRDWPVAVVEDVVAIGGGLLILSRFQ